MYAEYIKQEVPDLNGTGQTQAYYKMKLRHMDYEFFVKKCVEEGHMEESTIVAALSLVSEKLALFMAEGFSVKLKGIGTFHAKLGLRDDMVQDAFEPGEPDHNSKVIKVTGVSYRADNELINNADKKSTLYKGGESRLRKSRFTKSERIQRARKFLEKNMFMRVPDYVELTGLSRTVAAQELRKLDKDPESGIVSRGERSQKFYVLDKK